MKIDIQHLKNIDLEKLFYFYLVYRTGSIKETADHYGIPATALRHSLSTIEKKMDRKLYGTGRKLFMPTPFARSLYAVCRDIIESIGTLDSPPNSRTPQELIICSSSTFANYYLPPILQSFSQNHPDVRLSIRTSQNIRDSGAFDVLISSQINNTPLLSHKLAPFEYYLYGTPEMCEPLKHIQHPLDLRGQNLLLFEGDHKMDPRLIAQNHVIASSDSFPCLLHMCAQGMGFLSSLNIETLNVPGLNRSLIPLFPTIATEEDYGYVYYHRLSNKADLIESLSLEIRKFLGN